MVSIIEREREREERPHRHHLVGEKLQQLSLYVDMLTDTNQVWNATVIICSCSLGHVDGKVGMVASLAFLKEAFKLNRKR